MSPAVVLLASDFHPFQFFFNLLFVGISFTPATYFFMFRITFALCIFPKIQVRHIDCMQ